MENQKLKAAIWYRNRGFSVIPVRENKKPFIKWEKFQTKQADEKQLQAWWSKWPAANVAIVTGEVSKIMVVDADSQAGVDAVNEFLSDNAVLPICTTPGGGQHFYFRYKAGLSNGVRVITDTDFRTSGGYVIAPPSINGNGKGYAWIKGLRISEIDPPEMPGMLFDVLQQGPAPDQRAHASTRKKVQSLDEKHSVYRGITSPHITSKTNHNIHNISFSKGLRDESIFHIANCLNKGGMDRPNMLKCLKIIGSNCKPPFPEKEISAKVESAIKRHDSSKINLTQAIKDWISITWDNISITDALQSITSITFSDRPKVTVIMNRLVKDGILERVPGKFGIYRKVEISAPVLDIFSADPATLPIKFPLSLHELYKPMEKNVVVVAGAPDAGKTAFLLNFCAMNFKSGLPIRYLSSEMGAAELRDRIERLKNVPLSAWRNVVDFRERSEGFQDLIQPDGITVIDFLEITDNFYQVAARLTEFFNKLKKGVVVVGLQKDDDATYGRGKSFGREKPRLYLTLDSNPPEGNIATIIKCKNWRSSEVNPNGRKCHFQIINGINLSQKTNWVK